MLRPTIIFVNRYFYPDNSATSQMLSDLAFHLAGEGYPVKVITSRMNYADPATIYPARETVDGVDIIRVATTRFGRHNLIGRAIDYATFYITASLAALRHANSGTFLVAKTDPPLISVPLAAVAGIKGSPFGNWLQDVYPEVAARLGVSLARGVTGKALRTIRTWSLRRARTNIAIGSRMREDIIALGVDADKVTEIPNWCDDTALQPVDHSDNPVRAEWGLAPDDVVIAYSGNLGRAHDIDTLVGAADRLKEHKHIRFMFIGGGKLHDQLREKIDALALTNIMLKPYQPRDRLAQSLSAADIHWLSLLPALEGTIVPSKVYGIAAAGRPMIFIGARDGEIGRLIDQHDCGLTIAPGNSEELAQSILELSTNREKLSDLGQNARRMIDSGINQNGSYLKWRKIIDGIAAGQATSTHDETKERAVN